jgi:hypothetical protein
MIILLCLAIPWKPHVWIWQFFTFFSLTFGDWKHARTYFLVFFCFFYFFISLSGDIFPVRKDWWYHGRLYLAPLFSIDTRWSATYSNAHLHLFSEVRLSWVAHQSSIHKIMEHSSFHLSSILQAGSWCDFCQGWFTGCYCRQSPPIHLRGQSEPAATNAPVGHSVHRMGCSFSFDLRWGSLQSIYFRCWLLYFFFLGLFLVVFPSTWPHT